MQIRELKSKFVLTDRARANKILEEVNRLDCNKEVFIIGDE